MSKKSLQELLEVYTTSAKTVQKIYHGGSAWYIRPDTSDEKSILEVIRGSYRRKDFQLERGEHWLDLGAYVGAFTIQAVRSGAQVDCWEPDHVSRKILDMNLKLNHMWTPFATVHDTAVARTAPASGFGKLLVNNHRNGNYWRNSLHDNGHLPGGIIQVPVIAYASIVRPGDCVKMDIEGSEIDILSQHPAEPRLKKLVAEWSFDHEPAMAVYEFAVAHLREIFDHVKAPSYNPSVREWKKSWFPPCCKIFCWNEL